MLLSVNIPDVSAKRKSWIEHLSEYDKNKLVFIDESGINTNFTMIYDRAFGENRCVDSAPISTPKNTTILSSIRLNGGLHTLHTKVVQQKINLLIIKKYTCANSSRWRYCCYG